MRTMTVLLAGGLLCGCSSFYPIAPSHSTNQIIERGTPVSSLTLEQSRRLVDGWRQVYQEEALARRKGNLAFGEGIFLGSILAVGGVLFDKTGLMNTGAGIAGLSSVTQNHYVLVTQAVPFERAAGRMECIGNALMPLDPRDQGVPLATQELRDALLGVPGAVLKHTQRTRKDLQTSLNAIQLQAVNRDDLVAAIDKWRQAKTDASKTPTAAAPGQTVEEAQRQARFIKGLTVVHAEMDLCMQENTP